MDHSVDAIEMRMSNIVVVLMVNLCELAALLLELFLGRLVIFSEVLR